MFLFGDLLLYRNSNNTQAFHHRVHQGYLRPIEPLLHTACIHTCACFHYRQRTSTVVHIPRNVLSIIHRRHRKLFCPSFLFPPSAYMLSIPAPRRHRPAFPIRAIHPRMLIGHPMPLSPPIHAVRLVHPMLVDGLLHCTPKESMRLCLALLPAATMALLAPARLVLPELRHGYFPARTLRFTISANAASSTVPGTPSR